MTRTFIFVAALVVSTACQAQEVTLADARKEVKAAREKLEEVVTFCRHCRETGKLKGEECVACLGQPVTLKSEGKLNSHKHGLEARAERAGLEASHYAEFDVAARLSKLEEQLEPEAAEMLAAYVGYLKACQKYEALIAGNQRLTRVTERTIRQVGELVDRHGSRLVLRSLKMLYEDDPTGKVGAFNLYGKRGEVRVDGQDMEWLEMRTLKGWAILVIKADVKPRRGYVVAEIVSKGACETEDGNRMKAIVLRPW